MLIFSVYENARNFCLNCEKYLQISHKTHEGGRLYLEFEGRILFINIIHPYLEYPRSEFQIKITTNENNDNHHNINIDSLLTKYKDFVIISSMDRIDNTSMIEMKFQAFQIFCQKKDTNGKKLALIQLLYNVFESSYVKNIEYIDKLTQIADNLNKTLENHHIEVIYCKNSKKSEFKIMFFN